MYNWGEIRKEFLDGKTMVQISEDRGGKPTVGAISKRCKKENWRALATDGKTVRKGKLDCPEIRENILNWLENGATYKLAANASGVALRTLESWREKDGDFDAACQKAHAHVAAKAMKKIAEASDGGDLGASKWLAERHPESKHDFGPPQPQGGGAPQIVINIPRDESELPAVNRVIEHQD